MNRNIVRIFIIVVAILMVLILLRWSIALFLTNKRTLPYKGTISDAGGYPFLKDARELIKQGKRAEAIKALEDTASSKPGSKEAYASILMLADLYKEDGNLLKAKDCYIGITREYAAYCNYPDMQRRISELNLQILFSPVPTKDSEMYIIKPGDSIDAVAKKYSTTAELIKRANGLKTDVIIPGRKLKVQKVPFSIIIDKSQSTLTLLSGNEVVKTYIVSTGKNNSTPTGTFKIKNKLINPPWYSPNSAIIPAGDPKNALGARWMGFNISKPDYGIHGTNDPKSIGYQCTEGCVRMQNQDVEELYAIVPIETGVTIIN